MEARVSVSVEVVRVKEEPLWEQDDPQAPDILTECEEMPVCVKQEPSYLDGLESQLPCDGYAIKDELMVGPEDENPACVKEEAPCVPPSCGESGADQQVTTSEGGGGADQPLQQVTRLVVLHPVYVISANQVSLKPPVPRTRTRQLEKPFTCDICNKKFKYASHMARHKLNHEENKPARLLQKRPFFCVICNKPFSQLIKFTAHLEKHTSKPYYCEICSKGFSNHSAFVEHNEIHGDIYSCDLCEERFAHKIALLRHRLDHTVSEIKSSKSKRINILRRRIVS